MHLVYTALAVGHPSKTCGCDSNGLVKNSSGMHLLLMLVSLGFAALIFRPDPGAEPAPQSMS